MTDTVFSPVRFAGRYPQGADEHIPYAIDTSAWGGTPTAVTHKVLQYTGTDLYSDVTDVCAEGSPTVADDTIHLPKLHSLQIGGTYRVEVAFTSGGADWVPWFEVKGER